LPRSSVSGSHARSARLRSLLRLLLALCRPKTRAIAVRRVRRGLARRIGGAPIATATPKAVRPAPAPPATPTVDVKYVDAWAELASAVHGHEIVGPPRRFIWSRGQRALRAARLQRGQATFARTLAGGGSLEQATYDAVAALTAEKYQLYRDAAWALADGVGRLEEGRAAAAIGKAVIAHRRRQFARVWDLLGDLDDDLLATVAPVEAVDGALATAESRSGSRSGSGLGSDDARQRASAIAGRRERFEPATLVDLAGRFLAVGAADVAEKLIAELHARPGAPVEHLAERHQRSLALIEGWLPRTPKPVPAGAVPFAVIDYQTPDQVLASGNLGDYIQTLSLLGNLVRLTGVTFSGEADLGELATELRSRVRPDLRDPGPTGQVHLLSVNREFSSVDDLPPDTWLLAFGWHMHPMYDLRYDFPYHRNVRPLFLSFHVNRLDMLSDEALAYLRAHGPVGCRDWTTVELLLTAGVDAFFTGCFTTTADALFPPRSEVFAGSATVATIDLPISEAGEVGAGAQYFSHQSDAYRHMSLTDGVRAALAVLDGYQRDIARVITRRLHAYLPLIALGIPVDFRPVRPGDVRFPGLTGLAPGSAELADLQHGLRSLVAAMVDTILSGADPEAVYRRWRELTADRVAEAQRRFGTPAPAVETTVDVEAAIRASRAGARRFGPALPDGRASDVVIAFDQNLTAQAPVLVESLLANTARPVRLWVLGRGLDAAYEEWFAQAFPALPLTFFPCDHVDYGDIGRIPARITVSTMDRLLLPQLLTDVDRAIYLDIDTVVLGDVSELTDLPLGESAVAARDSNVSEISEWRAAAARLPEDLAVELQRRMYRDHGWGRPALNAGVLVLDLARMRADDFTRTYLGWVERYGLHDQDVMLAYANANRVTLPPRWNALPVLEEVDDPALIHWASISKPWDDQLTFAQASWRRYADQLRERAGEFPGAG